MHDVSITLMTRKDCHELFKHWEHDENLYVDLSDLKPYEYDEQSVNQYFDSKQILSRRLFAIRLDGRIIGEIQLKHIDDSHQTCTLSIHLQHDLFKNQGYGTKALTLAVNYAFDELGIKTILADSVIKNKRSQHVLEKAGFHYKGEDEKFRYYEKSLEHR